MRQIKRMIGLLGLTAVALTLHGGTDEWKLVWEDEFNYSGQPDPAKWAREEGFLRNHEAQYYTINREENARVEGGKLILETRHESFPNSHYSAGSKDQRSDRETAAYTSACLVTKGKATWQYGRFEIRAKLPRGRGIWPAIWMLGDDYPGSKGWPQSGEIDIMEYVGFKPTTIHANMHNAARHPKNESAMKVSPELLNQMRATTEIPEPWNDFHVYAMEWDASHIECFVDGKSYLSYSNPHKGEDPWPYDHPFYLLINTAVGGSWGGQQGIDDSIFPQRMEIDYVRVYQRGE